MELIFGLFGAGGFGREVMPLVIERFSKNKNYKVYFVDDQLSGQLVNEVNCISESQFLVSESSEKKFNIAVSDGNKRFEIASKLVDFKPMSIFSIQNKIGKTSFISEGAIFSHNTIVTENCQIGKYFHCNLNSYIGHDCTIGDFVTFAPGVMCNGNVVIEDFAYLGAGSIIRNGSKGNPLVIGQGAIVGMGAVVTKSVPPGVTVFGNPAKPY